MNVVEILDEAARRFPDSDALIWGTPGKERITSFRALKDRSLRIAALFQRCGLSPGDGVAVFLPLGGTFYEVMAAVLRLGMTAVFVDPSAWRDTLQQALDHVPVRGFVGTPAACVLRWFTAGLRRIPHAFCAGSAFPGVTALKEADGYPALDRVEETAANATALVTFTSGSTGRSKGVLRSHRLLAATHRILERELGIRHGQVHLTVLPFFAFANLGAGATSVIPRVDPRTPAAADAGALLQQMIRRKATHVVASPSLLERLADACVRERLVLPSLRAAFAGGAPVWPRVLDHLAAIAPQARIGTLYGATEAEPIALALLGDWGAPERHAAAAGGGLLAGRPVKEIALRILADRWPQPVSACAASAFDASAVDRGKEGEIVVSGAHVASRYLGGAGDSENKIAVEGATWHRTGDAGYIDESGRLWLVGRCAARISSNAGPVYPLRVEAALSGAADIRRATIIEHMGQPLLVVEPTREPDAIDAAELLARIPWCPVEDIAYVHRIPLDRRHRGKVDLPALRELLERRQWRARVSLPAVAVR